MNLFKLIFNQREVISLKYPLILNTINQPVLMLQYDFHKNTNVFVISMNIASQHSEVCSLPVCWRGVVASVSAAGRNAAGFETGK